MAINVQRFESVPGESVPIDAVWTVHETAGGEPRSGRTIARETVQGKDFEALAAAHSRALAAVSADIAAAIRDAGPALTGMPAMPSARMHARFAPAATPSC